MYPQNPELLFDYAQSRLREFRKEAEIERLLQDRDARGGLSSMRAWFMRARELPFLRELLAGAFNWIGIVFTPEESSLNRNRVCCAEG